MDEATWVTRIRNQIAGSRIQPVDMLVRSLFGLGIAFGLLAADPALDRAKTLYDQTNYDESLAILKSLPDSGPVFALRGRNLFMKNDFKRATELFERAIAAEHASADHYLWLGRAYGRRAETSSFLTAPAQASKARQNFERAVQLDPKNSDALSDLFEYYLQAPGFLGGGHDRAAALIEKIAALDPAERHFAQARLAEEKKDWNQA